VTPVSLADRDLIVPRTVQVAPRPDVLPSITPLDSAPAREPEATCSGASCNAPAAPAPPAPAARSRLEPLSATSYRVEFTASAALRDKLEHARNLLSHAVPSGDIAHIIERALDQLIAVETKRRSGAARPRKRRETKPGSRHVPVDVQRAVRERDQDQCTFTDAEGRRCSEKRFLTIEHIVPFAKGGPTTVENCTLLCSAHNAHRARQAFGKEHIRKKIAQSRARRNANDAPPVQQAPAPEPEPDVFAKVAAGLVKMGFARPAARRAVEQVRRQGVELRPEPVLRAALAVLT